MHKNLSFLFGIFFLFHSLSIANPPPSRFLTDPKKTLVPSDKCALPNSAVARREDHEPLTLKNTAVYEKFTPEEAKADQDYLKAEQRTTDASRKKTAEFVAKTKELEESVLQLENVRDPDNRALLEKKIARLKEELSFDYVVVGKGHNGIISVLEILKTDPDAKIAVIGAEPNFWGRMGFSIAIVGKMDGFMKDNASPALMREAEPSLVRHNGQMAGHFLGKWINGHVEGWQKGEIPGNVTVLDGFYQGGTKEGNQFTVPGGKDSLTLFSKKGRDPVFTPGLGKPLELPVTDVSGNPRKAKHTGEINDQLDGYRVTYNNIQAQDEIARGVRQNSREGQTENVSIMRMLERDNARAKREGKDEIVYLLTGNGDGAFSVLEGLVEGTFRKCCRNLKSWDEQADALALALGKIRIVWAGEDALEHGWAASLSIPRYEKIRSIIYMLKSRGKLEKIDERASAKYQGTDAKSPFLVTTGDYKDLPVHRIFHNNGNSGPGPMLAELHKTVHGENAPVPQRADLLRALNFRPVYDNPSNPTKVVGLQVLGKDGKPVGSLTGTGSVVLSLMLNKAIKDGKLPEDFVLGNKAERDRFLAATEKMDETMLHLKNWVAGLAKRDFNAYAQEESGGVGRSRRDFRNPAGVYESSVATKEFLASVYSFGKKPRLPDTPGAPIGESPARVGQRSDRP